ncbi:porin [Putridiphycobacter roseus]|uniref:Porin n=1 Tax=Putridiphycobacter roseus TaxID=2219161 RepID=A0A2W1N3J0_9FLAO|nr:porin [Putridiphycobacter roseus]PZE18424.1 porin [Putridiphycobacter roseus]
MKIFSFIIFFLFLGNLGHSQTTMPTFGKGLQFVGKDSSYTMKIGVRFQTLFINQWSVRNDDLNYVEDYSSNFLIRRWRLKFDGIVYSPKIKYKLELGLSNRDIGAANNPQTNFASSIVLDAYIDWNFYRNFSVKIGQTKLPGNRERVISSANLQFVDRSLLNSTFNIDRDIGLQFHHHFKLGNNFIIQETAALTQGEGRNVTAGNQGGFDYTFKVEFLPFGKFASKGDYVGSAVKYEAKPKLSVSAAYDINDKASKEGGQLGAYILINDFNNAKTLHTLFIDFMFKYKKLSIMGEYALKDTEDGNPNVFEDDNEIGTYDVGSGYNLSAGWMFDKNVELALRYTAIEKDIVVGNSMKEYTLGFSKFFNAHKFKFQTDLSYRDNYYPNTTFENKGKNDNIYWRLQFEVHF